jgi:Glycolipid 2-alpha-mannosyltransferase
MKIIDKSIIFYLVNNNPIHINRLFNSLKLLKQNFLCEYPYPVVFGHEGLAQDTIDKIKESLDTPVYFLKVNFSLPHYSLDIRNKIPERFKGHWDENAFFSMGYRHMCRFYAGDMFNYDFFSNVKYFMRMDCDSYFIDKLNYDPFRIMHEKNLIYGTTGEEDDMDYVIEGLSQFCQLALDSTLSKNIKYNGMYKTHFEIVDFQWFKNSAYKDFFKKIDNSGNIFIKRWGDAPIRYQGVGRLLSSKQIKVFELPYRHGGDIAL